MAKDPAFLFYPGDWQGGTATMTRHLKGCYIDLLIAQFNSGPLSLEEIKVVLGNDFATWGVLSKKFKQTEIGLFFNERLESEKSKRIAYSKSRSDNRKSTHEQSYDTSHDEHMKQHMDNENRNKVLIKKNKPPKKEFIPPTLEEFKNYCKQEGYLGISERAFKGYEVADWHDAKGSKIINWKQKLQNGWFKPENLTNSQGNNKPQEQLPTPTKSKSFEQYF